MRDIKTVSIVEDGQRYSGHYEVDERGLCVSSAYGSDRASLGRKADPDLVAKDLFKAIVQRWQPATARAPVKRRR